MKKRAVPILTAMLLLLGGASRAQSYTSRTDHQVAPETIPRPCSPAPCYVTSSDLNPEVRYLRVTSPRTDLSNPRTMYGTAGEASQREWNSNGTAFYVDADGGVAYFFAFDPATQSVSPIPCRYNGATCGEAGLLNTLGFSGSGDVAFSTTQPYVVYALYGSQIRRMDFTATVANSHKPPQLTIVADAGSCPGIPDKSGGSDFSIGQGDERFQTAFGRQQDLWRVSYVFDTRQGCRWFDYETVTVGGDWGGSGNATIFNEVGTAVCAGSACLRANGGNNYTCAQIHNERLSLDGRWVYGNTHCGLAPPPPERPGEPFAYNPSPFFFWDIATANVYILGDSGGGVGPYYGGGHAAMGFGNIFINNDQPYDARGSWFTKRVVPPTGKLDFLFEHAASDGHFSWLNQTASNRNVPILYSAWNADHSAPSKAWQDEIVGFSTDGSGVAWRFAHMYTRATTFAATGLAKISPDGRWAIFCSDWGGGGRFDVFLVGLR